MASVNGHPPMHQLAVLSMGWASVFHLASISRLVLVSDLSFILRLCFFLKFDIHTTSGPGYRTDLTILLTQLSYLPTNNSPLPPTYLPSIFSLIQSLLSKEKASIFSWLNLFFGKNLYFFMAKHLPLGKNNILFWLNLHLLTKPLYFLTNPLFLG
jgi:hypothetical protein